MKNKIALLSLFFLITIFISVNAQQIVLTPTYHSMGVKVTNISSADSCQVEYKKSNQSNWLLAYSPDKVTISAVDQFRGSLFLLDENTKYDVRVTVYDGTNALELPVMQQTTMNVPTFDQTSNVKWVSPNGAGNNYTQSNPGNINTLFTSTQLSCGTTVLLMDGIYAVKDGLSLNINNACTELSPIIIKAVPGANPIVEGGQIINSLWTQHNSIPHLYYTPIPPEAAHSNICVMGSKALYPYPSLISDFVLGNYNLIDLNFGYDGFVRDENTIWIKTLEGTNPNLETVTVSKSYRFLTVYGNNKSAFLKIKGITFKHFGKPLLNPPGSAQDAYAATVFDLRNVHHIYIDSCNFEYNTNNIGFSNQCDNFTIQHCNFKHDVGKWSHAMIKKSHVNLFINAATRGRAVESPAIFMHLCKQGIIRNNTFDGMNSGVESYFDTGFNEEIDVYNNTFIDNFDAIECDGLWSNLRAWNNDIVRPMAGISAAPPLIGPRYFFRNTIHGMKGRMNEADDPFFTGCYPVGTNYRGQGIGIKTNSEYEGPIHPSNLYFFNNTFHAEDTLGFVFTSWKSEWGKAIFINNAYAHKVRHPFYYFDLGNKTKNGNFQISSLNENYFSYDNAAPIIVAKHVHGSYDCTNIFNVQSIQTTLRSISGSANIVIQNPSQHNPLFKSTGNSDFELDVNSPLIDAGAQIQGFYDFKGKNPDIGAKESNFPSSVGGNDAMRKIKIYPNPTSDWIQIEMPNEEDNVTIRIFNTMGQLLKTLHINDVKPKVIEMNQYAEGVYFFEVNNKNLRSILKIVKI